MNQHIFKFELDNGAVAYIGCLLSTGFYSLTGTRSIAQRFPAEKVDYTRAVIDDETVISEPA
jgi:hypothetical protein